MVKIQSLNGEQLMSGTFGYLAHEGVFLNNVKDFEAKVEIEKAEVKTIGDPWTKHKTAGLKGSGTMTLQKIDYLFARKVSSVATPGGKPFVTELISQVDDPSTTAGKDKIRYKNVQFDQIPLAKYSVGEIIEEELPFTFEGFEFF